MNNESSTQSRSNGNCDVKILALYTSAAEQASSSIENLASVSVEITNQAFRNSDISRCDLKLELLATEEFQDYDETDKTFSQVMSNLRSSSFVASRRAFHKADIVVLFVEHRIMDDPGVGGIATLGPASVSPFATVKTYQLNNNGYTFSHEIGHVLGAIHEPCNAHDAGNNCTDGDRNGFEHAHTWTYETGCLLWKKTHEKKTIVYSGGLGSGKHYILHYSNPDVRFDGINTGIANERDNARQLELLACTVANYETGDEQLTVGIDGQDQMCNTDYACLYSQVSGSPGPYTYEWKFNDSGLNWNSTPVAGTNTYYCFSTPHPSFGIGDVVYFLLKVTSGNGSIEYSYHSIEIVEEYDDGLLCPRSILNEEEYISDVLNLSPNPTPNFLNLEFLVKNNSEVWVDIFNTYGIKTYSFNFGFMDIGKKSIQIDVSEFPNGIYFVQLGKEDVIYIRSFRKIE